MLTYVTDLSIKKPRLADYRNTKVLLGGQVVSRVWGGEG